MDSTQRRAQSASHVAHNAVFEQVSPAKETTTALVSVIVPVYNVEQYLNQCIESIVAQTHRTLEIILVNDGSTDNSGEICDIWAAQDERIHVIHKINGGVADTRNVGLNNAHGDYVYFVDSDDFIDKHLVEDCLAIMRQHNADIVCFQFDTVNSKGTLIPSRYTHNGYSELAIFQPEDAIKLQLQGKISAYFWAFIAPLELYRKQHLQFPVGRTIEDMARICNILGEAKRIVRVPHPYYHYRLRNGSLIGTITPQLISDWFKANEDRKNYILQYYPQLEHFVMIQSIKSIANLDFESIRQTIVYGLNLQNRSKDTSDYSKVLTALRTSMTKAIGTLTQDEDERELLTNDHEHANSPAQNTISNVSTHTTPKHDKRETLTKSSTAESEHYTAKKSNTPKTTSLIVREIINQYIFSDEINSRDQQ